MTRINANLKPKLLCDSMLLAEHREIVRIPRTIKSGKAVVKDIPKQFTLGKGHVKYMYDKLLFLKNRYEDLYLECLERGFNVEDYSDAFEGVDRSLFNDWEETAESKKLITQRITERLTAIKPERIRYYGEVIDKSHLISFMGN